MQQVKRSISNKKICYIAGILILVTLWQVFSLWIGQDTMVFPGPVSTLRHAFYLLSRAYTYKCILATMLRMLTGFLISLILGLLLGIPAGNDERISLLLQPFIVALRAVPTASLVYLFIVLAGFRKAPVYLVILIGFPIIYEGVKTGIANIDKALIHAAWLDGASFLKENTRVRLPLALPYIFSAAASAFSLSFKIEIMAEVITGASDAGLGSAILGVRSSDPTNMVPVFAYSVIAVALMIFIDHISSRIREKTSSLGL